MPDYAPLTDDEKAEINLLLAELGDEETRTLSAFTLPLWRRFEVDGPRVGPLRFKIKMLDIVIGHVWQQIDQSGQNVKTFYRQKFENLQTMRTTTQNELKDVTGGLRASVMSRHLPATGEYVADCGDARVIERTYYGG